MTYKKSHRGFTLIETLVAVLLLATAVAGPLTIASAGLSAALVAKDQIVATYLAQDAIEYIRYKRDSACLAAGGTACASGTWLSTLSACTGATGCYLDSTENAPASPTVCPTGGCVKSGSQFSTSRFLCYSPTTNRYLNGPTPTTCSSGTVKSLFARAVAITTPVSGSANEALVVVTVSWTDVGGVIRSVTAKESLLNWQ